MGAGPPPPGLLAQRRKAEGLYMVMQVERDRGGWVEGGGCIGWRVHRVGPTLIGRGPQRTCCGLGSHQDRTLTNHMATTCWSTTHQIGLCGLLNRGRCASGKSMTSVASASHATPCHPESHRQVPSTHTPAIGGRGPWEADPSIACGSISHLLPRGGVASNLTPLTVLLTPASASEVGRG